MQCFKKSELMPKLQDEKKKCLKKDKLIKWL